MAPGPFSDPALNESLARAEDRWAKEAIRRFGPDVMRIDRVAGARILAILERRDERARGGDVGRSA